MAMSRCRLEVGASAGNFALLSRVSAKDSFLAMPLFVNEYYHLAERETLTLSSSGLVSVER